MSRQLTGEKHRRLSCCHRSAGHRRRILLLLSRTGGHTEFSARKETDSATLVEGTATKATSQEEEEHDEPQKQDEKLASRAAESRSSASVRLRRPQGSQREDICYFCRENTRPVVVKLAKGGKVPGLRQREGTRCDAGRGARPVKGSRETRQKDEEEKEEDGLGRRGHTTAPSERAASAPALLGPDDRTRGESQ